MAEHNVPAEDVLDLGGGDGPAPLFLVGQRYRAIRRDDGSYIVLDQSTGNPRTNEDGTVMVLAPAAPLDPAKPNISFHTNTVTGEFFRLDANAFNDDGTQGVATVISEQTPEAKRGFQDIFEAISAIFSAGLDETKYQYVWEDGKVVPKLVEQISPTQDSFFTSTDGSGQLLAISRLTGIPTPIGQMPKATEGKVELDSITGQFKVTQPNGTISFLAAPVDIERPEEVKIGGQSFAFNPNTGGFVQVQQPRREFDPGVVFQGDRAFIQGPGGDLTPLGREEVPNLDELINSRIIAGDAAGALALSDFRDRPTSLEAFNAAMQFAQSPGDVAAISAISRGQSLVAPPPSGTVQRIAEQPEFLQDTYSRLINQFRGGSGSPGEFIDVLARINKELAESKAAQKADAEKNQQFEIQAAIDKAMAPILGKVSSLENELAVREAGKVAGVTGTKDKPVLPPPETISLEELFGIGQGTLGRDPTFTETQRTISQNPDFFGDVSGEDIIASGVSSFSPTTQSLAEAAATGESNVMDLYTAARKEAFEFSESSPSFFEHGGITSGPNLEIVGEGGPELVDLPPGTKVIPLKKLSKDKVKKLKEMGTKGFQFGGLVEDDFGRLVEPPSISSTSAGETTANSLLPFGVRRALAGVIIQPTRRRLSRAAGLPVLSAQARQNLLPEELEVFNRLSREAGIPEGAFAQEQRSAFPGANLARGRARFAARVLR